MLIEHFDESDQKGGNIDHDALRCIIIPSGHKYRKVYRSKPSTKYSINCQNEAAHWLSVLCSKSFELREQVNHSSIVSHGVSAFQEILGAGHALILSSVWTLVVLCVLKKHSLVIYYVSIPLKKLFISSHLLNYKKCKQ